MTIPFNLELDSRQDKKGENFIMIRCSQGKKHRTINSGVTGEIFNFLYYDVKYTERPQRKPLIS